MNSYKELDVWKKSFALVLVIYKVTKKFPASELYGLTSQMRRAVVSIPSTITEDFSRKSTKEYINFVQIAFASGAELETQLLLAKELGMLSITDYKAADRLLSEVMKMLNGLISSLRNKL